MSKHKTHHKRPAEAQPAREPTPAAEPAPAPEAVEAPAPRPAEQAVQPETPAPTSEALVEPPAEAVRRLANELEQTTDRHLRLAAEFDNFKKRAQRERTETWSRAQAELIAAVLDGLDDLGRVAHLSPDGTSARDVLAGVELVERKLARVLGQAGLERVGAEGEPFDPNVHEAVTGVPASSAEQDHRIASVLQPGYRFGGALLRPARVSVFLWHEAEPPADSPSDA
jgi:molecular chaperone GrpE